jgi:hypothetical protein
MPVMTPLRKEVMGFFVRFISGVRKLGEQAKFAL